MSRRNQNLYGERCHKINEDTELVETSSKRESRKSRRRTICLCTLFGVILVLVAAAVVTLAVLIFDAETPAPTPAPAPAPLPDDPYERALALLTDYPVIDGHNDLPYLIRYHYDNQFDKLNLTVNSSAGPWPSWRTDIPRLRAGKVGGQFWSAYMDCSTQGVDATRTFIDQIDVIKLLVKKYPDTFQFATTSDDIISALESNKIASLVGIEGGHAIDSSLGTLRQLYNLGARYMTLTHFCNTPWAHSSTDTNSTEGLNDFGRKVVKEMNRLGMMVDIAHVNNYTMMDVLNTSVAPVIFSHSSSYALCPVPRNVPDVILEKLKANNGIAMVNFYSPYINCTNSDDATVEQVADHIEHIKLVAGVDHVGVGSDFDGINKAPKGLEDVSKYPNLFAELIRRGFSDDDVKKISRLNLIRVLQDVEKTSSELQGQFPDNTLISPQPNGTCRPDF